MQGIEQIMTEYTKPRNSKQCLIVKVKFVSANVEWLNLCNIYIPCFYSDESCFMHTGSKNEASHYCLAGALMCDTSLSVRCAWGI